MNEYKIIVIETDTGKEYQDTVCADNPQDAVQNAYVYNRDEG